MLYQKILCATDGFEHSDRAVREAGAWAEYSGCELHVVYVADPPITAARLGGEFIRFTPAERRERVVAQLQQLPGEDRLSVTRHFLAGDAGSPAKSIAALGLAIGADVIVVGTRGRAPLAGALIGSVAQRLPHLVTTPVLIVPGREPYVPIVSRAVSDRPAVAAGAR